MANQSVLGSPSVATHISKEGFSMTQNFTFTAAAGMLLPVYKQFLNIGEKVKGVPRAFVRTEPLLAPSMSDLDLYVDVFFVPMRHLFSMFDAWFTQVKDEQSDLWNTDDWNTSLPVVSYDVTIGDNTTKEAFGWCDYAFFNNIQIVDPAYRYYNQSSLAEVNAMTFGYGAHRLAMHLGYNAQGYFANHQTTQSGQASYATFDYGYFGSDSILPEFFESASNIHQAPFVPYYFQAYQKIYYDYYRDSEFENNNVSAYNLDDYMNSGNLRFYPANYNSNRTGMFKLRFRSRSKDYFTAVHPSPLFNGIGMMDNARITLSRVKDWLSERQPDYNGKSILVKDDVYTVLSGDEDNPGVTTRNGTYFYSDGSPLDPDNTGGIVSNSDSYLEDPNSNIFHNHYINYAGDIEDRVLDVDSTSFGISLAQMRTAFAMDKLLRITNRAGKHVDDQMFAQFGVKIPQGVSGEVYKIKSYHCPFHIGEVVQSATTFDNDGNSTPLGEMAGRGVALLNSNEKFEFTAPCHGVLMAILSIAPRYKYAFGQEKDGMKVYIEDFFRPQYDNLGMQPLVKSELGINDDSITSVWQYRYMEDKIKYDKASMVFATNSKNPWTFVKAPILPVVTASLYQGNIWYKVNPWDTNNLFVVQWNGLCIAPRDRDKQNLGDYANGIYTHTPVEFLSNYLLDPFTIDFSMTNTLVSQMSTYGEPSLGGI